MQIVQIQLKMHRVIDFQNCILYCYTIVDTNIKSKHFERILAALSGSSWHLVNDLHGPRSGESRQYNPYFILQIQNSVYMFFHLKFLNGSL